MRGPPAGAGFSSPAALEGRETRRYRPKHAAAVSGRPACHAPGVPLNGIGDLKEEKWKKPGSDPGLLKLGKQAGGTDAGTGTTGLSYYPGKYETHSGSTR